GRQPVEKFASRLCEFELALPHRADAPAEIRELALFARISASIGLDLRPPISDIRGGTTPETAIVAMPEAAMHEERCTMPWKREIRAAGQLSIPNVVPQAPLVQFLSNQELR